MKFLLQIVCLLSFSFTALRAQPHIYSASNAHSHNDYRQDRPFYHAFNEGFGSIEADIHLLNGMLLVGHDSTDLTIDRTLEKMYLQPLTEVNFAGRKLHLLIDIKSASEPTLKALVDLLKKYPTLINHPSLRIIISGNGPDTHRYKDYPSFIWFDGKLKDHYSPEALSRIALLSENLNDLGDWKDHWPLNKAELKKINELITKAHALQKPVRFWANPDHKEGWEAMIGLKVDYINTDRINDLSDYITKRNLTTHVLPYNRIIRSAGNVVRFGNPDLENHALDVASLDEEGMVVIEDRYGIAALDIHTKTIRSRWSFQDVVQYKNYMSTYSGIRCFREKDKTWVIWSAADKNGNGAAVMIAEWNNGFTNISEIPVSKKTPARNAIPNEVVSVVENGERYIYLVLNGNDELLKLNWNKHSIVWNVPTSVAPYGLALAANKVYVSNWAGEQASDSLKERAGVPWGLAYTDPRTGATSNGTVSVFDQQSGKKLHEIKVGLHPNVVRASSDGHFIFVANGSDDHISVIQTKSDRVSETIPVGLLNDKRGAQGSTPNGLLLNKDNSLLYVSNGMDNAVAVIQLGKNASLHGKLTSHIKGYIPTEAYPAGLLISNGQLVVANLESDGANVIHKIKGARSIHNQLASVSIIPVPEQAVLLNYTKEVAQLNLINRTEQLLLPARQNMAPVPVPERIGEPSVFKHVVYIIKENKTYDQVFGDINIGKGDSSLCVFGEKITPNMHALAKQFGWMDDYYASGKSSAEGHQWTDAGMVSDYVEKNVRAWFRSYPHRQEDALVYNKAGFIWNHAMDHGKKVRIFGEACETEYDRKLKWAELYKRYQAGIQPDWYNKSTINRILPVISPDFPDCDNMVFNDQQRADIFIKEWKHFEAKDSMPHLMILSLPNDHTAGTSPDFPTPNAMVADNDLAVGRIVETISKSRFWDSTVIFITQDDSQSGWDHISAYRTIGLAISPYSSGKLVSSNYNQTSMLRTIEQILGIPPMNIIDATARLMTDCFQLKKNMDSYTSLPNNVPLDQMNKPLKGLTGKTRKMALISQNEVFNEVDGGKDDAMNRILWYYAKGNKKYPVSK